MKKRTADRNRGAMGRFVVSSFTRPDLSYCVEAETGEVVYQEWMHIDEDGSDYYDQLSRSTRNQLYEYDRMKMAATSRDDEAVLQWFISNAEKRGLSMDMMVDVLLDWFGPSIGDQERAAA